MSCVGCQTSTSSPDFDWHLRVQQYTSANTCFRHPSHLQESYQKHAILMLNSIHVYGQQHTRARSTAYTSTARAIAYTVNGIHFAYILSFLSEVCPHRRTTQWYSCHDARPHSSLIKRCSIVCICSVCGLLQQR
jgi:hypothetical protein